MKKQIISTVDYCGIISEEHLYEILRDYLKNLKRSTLENNLKVLLKEFSLYKLQPGEVETEGTYYILGSGADVEEDTKLKDYIKSNYPELKQTKEIKWEKVADRAKEELLNSIESMKEDALGLYKTPKRIELNYFDISIRYHQLRRFFYEKQAADALEDVEKSLQEFRELLDNLEI